MAPRVFGAVGKASTRIMVDAIAAATGLELPASVLIGLSPDADAGGLVWNDAHQEQAFRELGSGSVLVLNADTGVIAAGGTPSTTISFGLSDSADVQAIDLQAAIDGTTFTVVTAGGEHPVHLRLLGEHQVINALAAIAASLACGVPVAAAISALESIETLGRGRMHALPAAQGRLIIDDSISATAQSTAAALKALTQVAGERRSVAVLGELSVPSDNAQAESDASTHNEEHAAAHDRIGRLIVRLNIKKLVVVGHAARHIHNAAGLEGSWDGESMLVDTPQQAYDFLRDELREQDVVLVKSSRGLTGLADRLAEVTR